MKKQIALCQPDQGVLSRVHGVDQVVEVDWQVDGEPFDDDDGGLVFVKVQALDDVQFAAFGVDA